MLEYDKFTYLLSVHFINCCDIYILPDLASVIDFTNKCAEKTDVFVSICITELKQDLYATCKLKSIKNCNFDMCLVEIVHVNIAGYYWYLDTCTINSSPSGQNGPHSTDDIFTCIFMNEKFCILIRKNFTEDCSQGSNW